VFITHIPRTGKPVGNSTFTRIGGALGVVALAGGIGLITPLSASAADVTSSYAQGQFLSGTLAGTDLANVAELAAAEARNNGTQGKQTSKDPLDATVLQAVEVNPPQGVQLDLGDFLDAGAVNQYAEADKNGASMGSSGAIGDDGAIGVGKVGTGSAGDLDLDLNKLLGGQFSSVLTDLKLSLNAVSAQAVGSLNTASGDYTLADATLTFKSPAVGDLTNKVHSALSSVDAQLLSLGGDDGVLGNAVDGVLDPVLGVVGSSANVSASVTTDLDAAVASLLTSSYGNGAVHFNLETGEVSVDLATLLGGDLNDLPVNTELLSDGVINQVLKGITDTVATLSDQIVDRVKIALHNAKVDVHADLDLLTAQAPQQSQSCHDIQVPIIGDLPIVGGVVNGVTGGSGGGLGGLLGNLGGTGNLTNGLGIGTTNPATGAVQGIIGYTTQTVCDLVNTLLPDLRSTVNVDIEGTVDQILDGAAAKADASISLLGGTVKTAVNVNGIVDGLATGLANGLFNNDGAVTKLVNSLNSGLVKPAVTGLLGDGSVDTVLTDILSIRVNLQELTLASQQGMAVNSGRMFTETAVRVSALKGVGSTGLATVNVAAATVGPNITTVVNPPTCTTNCTNNPPTDGCVSNCTTTTGTGTPSTAASRLAMTGVGIATLIAVILALLAAGAYLAREGYRRNHPHSVTPTE